MENQRLPKFISLFINSTYVKPTINKSAELSRCPDMNLLAPIVTAVKEDDEIKNNVGSESITYEDSSQLWEA